MAKKKKKAHKNQKQKRRQTEVRHQKQKAAQARRQKGAEAAQKPQSGVLPVKAGQNRREPRIGESPAATARAEKAGRSAKKGWLKEKTAIWFAGRPKTHIALFGYYLFFIIYCEVLLRAFCGRSFLGVGILVAMAFAVPTAGVLTLLSSLLSERANRGISIGISVILSLLFSSQFLYYKIFYTFYTVFSMLNGAKVFSFMSTILLSMLKHFYGLILFALPVLLYIALCDHVILFERMRGRRLALTAGLSAAAHCLCLMLLLAFGVEQFSPFDLYYKTVSNDYSVDRLGLLTSMRIDATRLVTGFEQDYSAGLTPDTPPPEPEPEPPKEPTLSQDPAPAPVSPPPEPLPLPDRSPNVLDIDFKRLSETEEDKTLKDMHEFFASLEPTKKNEKTGLFQGKNLIMIVAEGYSYHVIDRELTPTLYKLQNEGFFFPEFYTPIWGVSTLDGEYVALQGLIPKPNVWSMWKSSQNYLPFTLGNAMGALGYDTYAYHNHDYDYYNRGTSHPNLGYTYKGIGNGLEMEEHWPRSDLEMVDVTTAEYMGKGEPYSIYYLTVSGHLLYNFIGNEMAMKNRELTEHLDYSEPVRAYIACQIELDRALALLLERLEESGELDDTVIALVADHYPYGLSALEISELAGEEIDPDFELYHNGLIIYRHGMEPETVPGVCSSLDVLPTLLNLFGIEYDSRLIAGSDIFGDQERLVVLSNRSFITDRGRYNSRTGEFLAKDDAALPEGYREQVSRRINQMFSYSEKILDYDYYGYLRENCPGLFASE